MGARFQQYEHTKKIVRKSIAELHCEFTNDATHNLLARNTEKKTHPFEWKYKQFAMWKNAKQCASRIDGKNFAATLTVRNKRSGKLATTECKEKDKKVSTFKLSITWNVAPKQHQSSWQSDILFI